MTIIFAIDSVSDNGARVDVLRDQVELLEEDVSFNVALTAHTLLDDNPTVFDVVRHNQGLGYNVSTGEKLFLYIEKLVV